ncbi:intermembrane phospholipid transport protein YdbH family protein [Desulfatitalea alkaliphila]|uniref:YdbH domain-containing protein n=1 Tax=Desulfatitalea alkaliphila TaxID=2929485 RepID=A0AA41R6T8_9BACT|nr:YdbH domain-containing protein [Desulfatitalea alkaliphila]MCJ8502285.1 YdbH domain-containing protein [Desulfatitalea alkaliphila]
MHRPTRKTWLLIAAGLLLVPILLLTVLHLFLPPYLASRVVPRLAAQAGIQVHRLDIRHIGWRSADLGPLHLSMAPQWQVTVAAVQLNYAPADLLRRKLAAIVISAPRIQLRWPTTADAPRPEQHIADRPVAIIGQLSAWLQQADLPVSVDRLMVENGLLAIDRNGQLSDMPFDLEMRASEMAAGLIEGRARLGGHGTAAHLSAALAIADGQSVLSLSGEGLALAVLAPFLPAEPAMTAAGRMDFTARVQGSSDPPSLGHIDLQARLEATRVAMPELGLGHLRDAEGAPLPIEARLTTTAQGDWQWRLGPLRLDGPMRLDVVDLAGTLAYENGKWHATAGWTTLLPAQPITLDDPMGGHLAAPISLAWEATAHPDEDGIRFAVHGATPAAAAYADLRLDRPTEARLNAKALRFNIAGFYAAGALTTHAAAILTNLRIRREEMEGRCPEVTITGDLDTRQGPRINGKAIFDGLTVQRGSLGVELPANQATFRLQQAGDNGAQDRWQIEGELRMDKGRLNETAHELGMQDLSVRLPFQWPPTTALSAGTLKSGAISWRKAVLGHLEGRLGQLPDGGWVELTHQSKLFPGLNVLIDSRLNGPDLKMTLTVPSYRPAQDLDLGRLIPEAAGFRINGRVSASAEGGFESGALRSSGRIQVEAGRVHHPQSGLRLDGIVTEVGFTDLQTLRTAPAQQLRVARMRLGQVAADDLRMAFQLEPAGTLFIENLTLEWARGRMQTQAFRLNPQRMTLATTIHGDRLDLAMVLNQLGIADGSGEGTVNGSIPVSWQEGRLRFDDGFLYSTPGQGGTIQLRGLELPLDGLPPGAPQRTQLDIATEALRDYSYNWAKLYLASSNGELLVRLQLDGKPNRLLPFAYDPQTGGFQRYAGEGQADFQGIGIDINFRTPLDRIMDYKTLWTPGGA